MNKEYNSTDKKSEKQQQSATETTFFAAIGQMAQLLRVQAKGHVEGPPEKTRKTKILSATSLPTTFHNSLEQMAKLLRSQIQTDKPKKRRWKARRSSTKGS